MLPRSAPFLTVATRSSGMRAFSRASIVTVNSLVAVGSSKSTAPRTAVRISPSVASPPTWSHTGGSTEHVNWSDSVKSTSRKLWW